MTSQHEVHVTSLIKVNRMKYTYVCET